MKIISKIKWNSSPTLYIVRFFKQVARDISKCQSQFLCFSLRLCMCVWCPVCSPYSQHLISGLPQRLTAQVETTHVPTGSQLLEKLLSLLQIFLYEHQPDVSRWPVIRQHLKPDQKIFNNKNPRPLHPILG